MNLRDFENQVDAKMVERGRAYFRDDTVCRVVKITPDEIGAVVRGTQSYNVWLKTNRGTLVKCLCNCPYDGGACKHVVALLFYLRAKGTPATPSTQEMMQDAHEQALRAFVTERLREDWRLRRDFINAFGPEEMIDEEDDERDDDDEQGQDD